MEFNKWDFLQISLGVLFVGLKLAGIIQWSWWLVLLPFYIGIVAALALIAVAFVLGLIVTIKLYYNRYIKKENI